jgi:putative spermidine/putrescine transport system ATP-binding protein
MSDRIVVMHDGRAEQVGTPSEIYNRPATRFVASFVGTLNILSAMPGAAPHQLMVDGQTIAAASPVDNAIGEVSIAIRPEALGLAPRPGASQTLAGTVESVEFLGAIVRIRLRRAGQSLVLDTFNTIGARLPHAGEALTVHFSPEDVLLLGAGAA